MPGLKTYVLEFVCDGHAEKWTKVLPYLDDAAAIAEGEQLMVAFCGGRSFAASASLLMGAGADRSDVRWLGAWRWDGAPRWMAAD